MSIPIEDISCSLSYEAAAMASGVIKSILAHLAGFHSCTYWRVVSIFGSQERRGGIPLIENRICSRHSLRASTMLIQPRSNRFRDFEDKCKQRTLCGLELTREP